MHMDSRQKNDSNQEANPLLAEGFRNVDSQTRDEQLRCVQCLRFIKSHPEFLKVRDAAFEKMELHKPNMTVYDVGCGAGFDTLEMAGRMTSGNVVGIDISSALIDEANSRASAATLPVPVRFMTGDARKLTNEPSLPQQSADRVYMERALQHIPRDGFNDVLEEYFRALKPGGLFVSVEPNWELFTVRSNDVAFFRKLHHHWVDRFNHGNVAMNISPGMRSAGFVDVSSQTIPVEFSRFGDGELVYDFTRTARELVAKGGAPAEQAAKWLDEQHEAGGDFYCCLMMVVTTGRKP